MENINSIPKFSNISINDFSLLITVINTQLETNKKTIVTIIPGIIVFLFSFLT